MKTCKKNHKYSKNLKQCPDCKRITNTQYRKNNPDKIKLYDETFYKKNANKVKAKKAQSYKDDPNKIKTNNARYYRKNIDKIKTKKIQYYLSNKDKIQTLNMKYAKNRVATDPLFYLSKIIRSLIYSSLKNKFSKKSKTHQLLGCSFEESKAHLINTAIKNYGFYDPNFSYHIDHIVPCSSAKTEEELIKLQHYTNLQYLTPEDNLKKSDSWDGTVENESWKYEC